MEQTNRVILTVSIPLLLLLLLSFTFFLVPPRQTNHSASLTGAHRAISFHSRRMLGEESKRYAVVFDAGSSGSRVHVFCFDGSMNLVPIGDEVELFKALKPGLSSYASNPEEGANSLKPLLEAAESVVPAALCSETPVRLGATAGLRALKSNTSEAILQAVRDLLKYKSSFKYEEDSVTILDGSKEGSYLWVAINYLLEKLGNQYPNTVGVVDLGGGSVQMAYAISKKAAKKSPKTSDGKYSYVEEFSFRGSKYYLYVHSYSNYGLLAARAEILKAMEGSDNPCTLYGYNGYYKYSGVVYNASASQSGSSFSKCKNFALKALKVKESCEYEKCTFGGVWNGGGGAGMNNLFVASFFYDKAAEVGFIDSGKPSDIVKISAFRKAAKHVCNLSLETANKTYTRVSEIDLPYLCMDLVYQYTLLTDGFGLHPQRSVTLVTEVKYKNYMVGSAWPLGSAIDVLSSSSSSSLVSSW